MSSTRLQDTGQHKKKNQPYFYTGNKYMYNDIENTIPLAITQKKSNP